MSRPKGFRHTEETKAKISAAEKGERNPMYGKHLSKETKAKISLAIRGRHLTEEWKAKIRASDKKTWQDPKLRAQSSASRKGKHPTEEARANMSAAQKGKYYSEERKARMSIISKILWQDPEYRAKVVALNKASQQSPEYKARVSAIHKAQWRDPEFTEKMMKARRKKPNQAELRLQDILNRHYPSEWKFVGDGQVNLGGRFPDFININGKKELIELFGTYWHPLFDVAQRKEHYRQYGFRVAVIWEDELEDEGRLVKTLKRKLRWDYGR